MPKGYNSLNDIKINTFEIGICPICSHRLTAECEHRTDESETWYAAQILAEQEMHNDEQPLPWEVISDTVAVYPEVTFGNVVFDINAIAENIRTRSDELKSKIDARATAARERMGERH